MIYCYKDGIIEEEKFRENLNKKEEEKKMLPRKKRKTILIISIILFILIIIVSLALLYINTDMFKSNATLFSKYIGQNLDNIETVYKQIGTNPYEEIFRENKYVTRNTSKNKLCRKHRDKFRKYAKLNQSIKISDKWTN